MLFSTHVNQVSVVPTNGIGPTQGRRKTLNRVGIEPTTFGLNHRRRSWEFHGNKYVQVQGRITFLRVTLTWVENSASHYPPIVNSKEKGGELHMPGEKGGERVLSVFFFNAL